MFGIYHRMQAHPSGRASPRVDKRIMSETTCFDPVLNASPRVYERIISELIPGDLTA